MKKIFRNLVVLFLTTLVSINLFAYGFVEGGIYYKVNYDETSVSVTHAGDYNTYHGNIVIPSSVTDGEKIFSVTAIDAEAFKDCNALYSVVMPNSVESIGSKAFEGCVKLKNLILSNNITRVYDWGLSSSSLKKIVIPKKVSYIQRGALGHIDTVILLCPTPPELDYTYGEDGYKYRGPGGKNRFVPCELLNSYQESMGKPEHASKQMWKQFVVYGATIDVQTYEGNAGYDFYGQIVTQPGWYINMVQSDYGCDTIKCLKVVSDIGECSYTEVVDKMYVTDITPTSATLHYNVEKDKWTTYYLYFVVTDDDGKDTILSPMTYDEEFKEYYCTIQNLQPNTCYKYAQYYYDADFDFSIDDFLAFGTVFYTLKTDYSCPDVTETNVKDHHWVTDITSNSAILHSNYSSEFDDLWEFIDSMNAYFLLSSDSIINEWGSVIYKFDTIPAQYDPKKKEFYCKLENLLSDTTYTYGLYYIEYWDDMALYNSNLDGDMPRFKTLKDNVAIETITLTDSTEEDILIYPNPTKENVSIVGAKGNITLINSVGQVVKQVKYKNNLNNPNAIITIDVKDLESGIYYVKCGKVTKKLVVK